MNLRRSSLANVVDTAFFKLGVSLISRTTVVPPLVSRLTDSKVAIGLAPALSVSARRFHIQTDAAPVITFPLRKPARLEELFDGGEIRVADGTCQIPHEFGATKLYTAHGHGLRFSVIPACFGRASSHPVGMQPIVNSVIPACFRRESSNPAGMQLIVNLAARQGHSGMTVRRGLPDKGIRA